MDSDEYVISILLGFCLTESGNLQLNQKEWYHYMTDVLAVMAPYGIGFTAAAWFLQRHYYTKKLRK